jgi:hypothetical protein
MGVWGAGLYAGDFAMDLRSAARAVTRLPFDGDRLAELVCSVEPGAAKDSGDTDHTTFWLVVAYQFAKHGIESERVRKKALDIIDGGADLAMLSKLGMDATGLRKRQKILAELRRSVSAAAEPAKPRRVLKKPQPLVMQAGEVLVYPTSGGKNINPYFPSKERMVPAWRQDGWSAAVIVECGHAFEFLAWYRPLTIAAALPEKPGMAQIHAARLWVLKRPGTCSALHFKKMEFEKIGAVAVTIDKLDRVFPARPGGLAEAVNDISIANRLDVGPEFPVELIQAPGQPPIERRGRPYPAILGLDDILS